MVILRDTTLCAIVRDEMMNPAGGIQDFVESTVPFVERARIIDTGSKDGTREYLEEAKKKYPQLEIGDHVFNGYGPSRNVSIQWVNTDWILILDADERIRKQDFPVLEGERANPRLAYLEFYFLEIQGTEVQRKVNGQFTNRFFRRSLNTAFNDIVFEYPTRSHDPERDYGTFSELLIYHFVAAEQARKKKRDEWYNGLTWGKIPKKSPGDCPSFLEWKAYNPEREKYR